MVNGIDEKMLKNILNPDLLKILFKHGTKHQEPEYSDELHLKAAISWLLNANDKVHQKGIPGFYSLVEGWYSSYPETTGYLIETFLNYYHQSKDENILNLAIKMADWEIDIQLPSGAVRGFCLKSGLSEKPMIFDSGQVIIGWNALYKFTKDTKYLESSIRAAHWTATNQNHQCLWDKFVYKNHCGTYFSRVAFALIETAILSNREDLFSTGTKFMNWVLSQQNENGYFDNVGFLPEKMSFIHNISYTLEGLILTASTANILIPELTDKYFKSVEITLDSLLSIFSKHQTFYGEYKNDWTATSKQYIGLPGLAQIAWCYFRMFQVTNKNAYFTTANELIRIIKKTQILDTKNKSIYGGIFGSFPIWGKYQRWRIVSWGAKFFIDALLEKNKAEQLNKLSSNPIFSKNV
jgi:hypothetical protein